MALVLVEQDTRTELEHDNQDRDARPDLLRPLDSHCRRHPAILLLRIRNGRNHDVPLVPPEAGTGPLLSRSVTPSHLQ